MINSVSVCIPVYNAEKTLRTALDSVIRAAQDFDAWEIILVNDGSSGRDENGFECKKIVKKFRRANRLSKHQVVYLEHKSNLGLLEARRTAIMAAHGKYLLILDSDDKLAPGALKVLYETAETNQADIVQGGVEVFTNESTEANEKRRLAFQKNANKLVAGPLCNSEILNSYLVKKNHTGFLWAKLFRRDLYLRALNHIPFTRCVFAEDFLQYFFICLEAKKYYGLQTPVYEYFVDSGISSFAKITSLERWEKICSTANVFTIIFTEIKNRNLSLDQLEAIKFLSRSYLANNIKQLSEAVIPELQDQARSLLCDYWGEDFVELMEKEMNASH